jgi:zinc protease
MGDKYIRCLPQEPVQDQARRLTIEAAVPLDAFVKTWHMDARLNKGYYTADLITEILGGGASSRLYQSLVKEQKLFSNLDCYHFGSLDAGLLTIEGKLVKGVDINKAEQAISEQIALIQEQPVSIAELTKVKNKTESVIAFEDMSIMSRASSLAMYELMGDASLMNTELEKYQEINPQDIVDYSKQIFRESNSNTLHYLAK